MFKGPAHHLLNRPPKVRDKVEGDDQPKIRRLTPEMVGGALSTEQLATIKAKRPQVVAAGVPVDSDEVARLRSALEAAAKAADINPKTATLPELANAIAAIGNALKDKP